MEEYKGINAKTVSILFLIAVFVGSVVVVNFYEEQAIRFTGMVVYGEEDLELPQDVLERIQAGESVSLIVEVDEPKNPLWVSSSERGNLNAQDLQIKAQSKISTNARKSQTRPYMSVEITKENINEIRKNPFIKNAQENVRVKPMLDESVEVINAPQAWDLGNMSLRGEGQTICVIDTGVDYTHPDLGGCTTEQFLNGTCEKVIGGYDFYNDNNDPMDINGHGTHVAGTVAADGTYKGVAPKSKIVALKSMEDGGTLFDTIQSAEWCINNREQYNISVISMSLGTTTTYSSYCDSNFQYFADVINDAVNKGMSVVSATGNDGDKNGVSLPACYENSIRATRTNNNDNFANSANRGSFFNDILAAPGSGIVAPYPGGGYASLSGTSMSTPHISGAIAIIYQYNQLVLEQESFQDEAFMRINESGPVLYDSEADMNIVRLDLFEALTVNNDLPPVIFLSIISDKEFGEENVTFEWEVTDNHGVNKSNLTVSNPLNQTIYETNQTIGNHTLNTSTLNITGKYTIHVEAVDVNNNTATQTNEFSVKQTPSLTILANNETNLTLFDTYQANLLINTTYTQTYNVTINNVTNSLNQTFYNETINLTSGENKVIVNQRQTNTFFEKSKNITINAINTTIKIEDKQPTTNTSMLENETKTFLVNLTNPLQTNLTSYFTKNEEILAHNQTSHALSNASVGYHNITFFATNNQSNASAQWNVEVNATPPKIQSVTPSQTNITLDPNETITFSYNATDYKNRNLTQTWAFDNKTSTNKTYIINTTNKEPNNHTLHLIVSNSYHNVSNTWNIEILPPIQPLNYTLNISNIEFDEDTTYTLNLEDYLEFDERDNLTHNVRTSVNYEINNNQIIFDDDPKQAPANITTTGLVNNQTTNTFNITINEIEEDSGSSGGSSGGGGGGGGLPPPSTDPAEEDQEDQEEEEERVVEEQVAERVVEIRETDTRVLRGIRAQSKKTDFTVNVEEVETTPVNFERNTYRSFRIEANDNVTNASIDFEISKDWLNQNNLTASDVALYRLNNEWEELETKVTQENQTHTFYEAFTPGFSYFTIGEKEREITIEEQTPMPQPENDRNITIGLIIWALISMMLFFSVVYALKNHNKSHGK